MKITAFPPPKFANIVSLSKIKDEKFQKFAKDYAANKLDVSLDKFEPRNFVSKKKITDPLSFVKSKLKPEIKPFKLPSDEEFNILYKKIMQNENNKAMLEHVNLTKENILVADKILSEPKLYENLDSRFGEMGNILLFTKTAEAAQAKMQIMEKYLNEPKLYENQGIAKRILSLVYYTETSESAQAAMQIINKYLSEPKLQKSQNISNCISDFVLFPTKPLHSKFVNKFLSDPKLYENRNIMKDIGGVLHSAESDESIHAKMKIMDKYTSDPMLYKNNILKDCIGEIIKTVRTLEHSEFTEEMLCTPPLFKNPNFLDIFKHIINRLDEGDGEVLLTNLKNYDIQNAYPKLSNLVRNEFVSADELNDILTFSPATDRNIGSVPGSWLNRVPKEERAKTTSELFEALGNFAKKKSTESTESIRLSQKLQELLNNQNVSIEFIKDGSYGNTYNISVDDKPFLLKTFHSRSKYKYHSAWIEPQIAPFANAYCRKNQFVKFFFGRVTGSIYDDAFMVNKFLEDKISKAPSSLKNVHITSSKPFYTDFASIGDKRDGHNLINGTIFDFGAFYFKWELLDSKIRKTYRIFAERIYENTYNNGNCDYVMSEANAKILSNYAKKNLNEAEFSDAMNHYLKLLPDDSKVGAKLRQIKSNLYGNV